MNNYFSNIFTIEDLTNIPEAANMFQGLSDANKLENFVINEQQVKNKLENLKVSKSPGPDDIHAKLLFELGHS